MKRAAAALAVCALAGCGGSSPSGVAPTTYVRSVCTALGDWSRSIKAAGAELQRAATGTASLAKGKQQYQTFIGELLTDTGRAADALKSAGVPAVKNGKATSDALVKAFVQAKAGLSRAAQAAAGIPTTSAAAYQAAASGVTNSIRQTLGQMAAVQPQKDPQLHAAASKEKTCQALTSSTS